MSERTAGYNYYCNFGGGYYSRFLKRNPEFAVPEFQKFVVMHNKGDRDSGELQDIAKHEVLRLAYEYQEYAWRFPHLRAEQSET